MLPYECKVIIETKRAHAHKMTSCGLDAEQKTGRMVRFTY